MNISFRLRNFLQPNRCTWARNAKKFSSSRDVQMAGRRRFYKEVNIQATSPPWDEKADNENSRSPVDSPISAGVDNSPSGILHSRSQSRDGILIEKRKLLSLSQKSSTYASNWYTILLDNRPLRTPAGNSLTIPSLSLALGIAAEWDAQKEYLVPTQMPLMTLACTVLDQTSNSIAYQHIQENCMKYLFNDTTCYYTDPSEDRVLYRKQQKYWQKIHDFVERALIDMQESSGELKEKTGKDLRPAIAIGYCDGILLSRNKGNQSTMGGLPHPPALVERLKTYVESLNAWELACLQAITMEAKSLLVGFSLIKSVLDPSSSFPKNLPPKCFDGRVQDFVLASRVEEEFQIENWGLVEGGHDYDRLNCSVQVTAASFMLHALK